jgi:hypothetical protein
VRSSHLSYRPNLLAGNILTLLADLGKNDASVRLASRLDQKSTNISEIQAFDSRHFIISERMSIARRHIYTAMPQEMLNCYEVNSRSHETSCKRVTKVVESQVGYFRRSHRLHEPHFRIAETLAFLSRARKNKLALALFRTIGRRLKDCFVHRDTSVTLSSLAVVDRDKPLSEIYMIPAKPKNFALAHASV